MSLVFSRLSLPFSLAIVSLDALAQTKKSNLNLLSRLTEFVPQIQKSYFASFAHQVSETLNQPVLPYQGSRTPEVSECIGSLPTGTIPLNVTEL